MTPRKLIDFLKKATKKSSSNRKNTECKPKKPRKVAKKSAKPRGRKCDSKM